MTLAEDIRKTLQTQMTICEFRQEKVAERISALLPSGTDPFLKNSPGVAPEPTAVKRAVCRLTDLIPAPTGRAQFTGVGGKGKPNHHAAPTAGHESVASCPRP